MASHPVKNGQAKRFFGTTTLGKKGQAVIPAEARAVMKLQEGEKLLVFGMGTEMIVLSKLSKVEEIATVLAKRLQTIRGVINKSK
jgi:AbrB family looped-hinge helix DNA binding protein